MTTTDLNAIVDPAPVGRRLSLERIIVPRRLARVIPEVVTAVRHGLDSRPQLVHNIRRLALALTAVIVGYVVALWIAALMHPAALGAEWGGDFRLYTDAARRWLEGGTFYQPYQLGGAYHVERDAILYPPSLLVLLVPFLVIPAPLWWILPLGILAWHVVDARPAPWTWPLLLLPLAVGDTNYYIVNGTPTIWIAAFVALGLRRPVLSALVLLKPSVFPFALPGIRDPRWWALAVPLGLVCLTMGYPGVIFHSDGTLAYSIPNIPLLLIPVIAWVARKSRPLSGAASAVDQAGDSAPKPMEKGTAASTSTSSVATAPSRVLVAVIVAVPAETPTT